MMSAPTQPPPMQAVSTRDRIKECLKSATHWAKELPCYADRQQQKADRWAVSAGLLATLTSLAIFPVLSESATFLELRSCPSSRYSQRSVRWCPA